MRLFAIGDLHLPSARGKRMDRFGWKDHPRPLAEAWDQAVAPSDLVLVLGDTSWATRPSEVEEDLAWIHERQGRKVLLKGNHDFWWPDSRTKLGTLLAPFPSIVGFLHNGSALREGPYVIAGVRGWTVPEAPQLPGGGYDPELDMESYQPHVVERDLGRLRASVQAAEVLARDPDTIRVACMHFPPVYAGPKPTRFSPIIEAYRPAVCAYGHLHGPGIPAGFVGEHNGVRYVLTSCDAARFAPIRLL
ncbi:metallophosphoesterase [Vulgatibacter incomptus]|uniref:Phosphohydrolase n=1 Tax=Vulgatibacter incomptus TaxID=1391653 RepID=A0A0K1P9J0_9BACT|nr:metallophosphoesterase [Vulgatibacter incomptus]AKU90190.1 Phosphohydrolase [Vulgatibacter incomptus]